MADVLEEKNMQSESEEKLDFKRIFPIFIIVLIDILGLTIIIPLLPLYATSFGASPTLIGLLAAAYPIMQFIGAPVLGRLSDRYGRKPILVISQIGTFIGFLMLGFANSLIVILLSRIIDGISGANIATAQAAISDVTTEKTRTQGLGLIGAAFGLGFIIGPVIAFVSLAATDNNYQVPAFAAAVCSLLSILLTAFWLQETLPEEKRRSHHAEGKRPSLQIRDMFAALRHPTIGLLLLLMFGQQLAFGGFEQILALFTLNRLGLNASGNALVFIYVGIIVVAVQGGLIGKWSRKYGDRRLVYGGLALLAIGLFALGITPSQPVPWYSETAVAEELSISEGEVRGETVELPDETNNSWLGFAWLLVAMIPVSIGGGILQPSINSLITKRIDSSETGGMLGISAAFYSLAMAMAPIFGGFLFQTAGATNLFILWALMLGTLFLIALRFLTPGKEEQMKAGLARGSSAH